MIYILTFMVEEIILALMVVWGYGHASEQTGETLAGFFGFIIIALALSGLVQFLLDRGLKKLLIKHFWKQGKKIFRIVLFFSLVGIEYLVFSVMEHILDIPASFFTLLLVSVMVVGYHLFVRLMVDHSFQQSYD